MSDLPGIQTDIDLKSAFTQAQAGIQVAAAEPAPQALTPSQLLHGAKLPATPENRKLVGLG